jgi:hypothetical protein
MDLVTRKPGRPPIHGRARLAVLVRARILNAERTAWAKAAKAAGVSLSEWIRSSCNRAAGAAR